MENENYQKIKLCSTCKRNGIECGQIRQGIYGRTQCSDYIYDGANKVKKHWFWG